MSMMCSVEGTWAITNDDSLSDILACTEEGQQQAETAPGYGVTLYQSETNTTPCIITLHHPEANICSIDMLCDAKRAEVFSHQMVYIDTIRGVRVDEELGLDRPLYMIQYSLNTPATKCSFRLVSLTTPEELWIHSIYVTIATKPAASATMAGMGITPAIDLEKVKVMLDDMGQELPEKAKHLLGSVEMFQKSRQTTMDSMMSPGLSGSNFPNQIASLLNMFTAMNTTGTEPNETVNSSSRDISPKLNSDSSEINESVKQSDYPESDSQPDIALKSVDSSGKDKTCSQCGHNCHDDNIGAGSLHLLLKVEQRFQKALKDSEERIMDTIMNRVTDVENKIQYKLDLILQKVTSQSVDAISCDNSQV